MVRITKDVLRKLNAAGGKLDTDSGKVFLRFTGRMETSDRLFHGELSYAEVGEDKPEDTVSIKAILSLDSSAKPAKPAKSSSPAKSDKTGRSTDKEI